MSATPVSAIGMGESPKPSLSRSLLEILVLAALYFVSGKFGLSLAFLNASASPVWPPAGLAVAALILRGYRLWPAVLLGAFLVNLSTQGSVLTSLAVALGNTLEALAGAMLVIRFANGKRAFEQTNTTFRFLLLAPVLSTAVSATIGVTSLCLGGFASWSQYFSIWHTWWLGDCISDIIFAPLLLIWLGEPFRRPQPERILEFLLLFSTVLLLCGTIFSGFFEFGRNHIPLGHFCILPLLWAAFSFGPQGVITCAFLVSGAAIWGTLNHFGPFARAEPNASLLLVQAFIGTITLTALVLSANLAERKKAEHALEKAQADLALHAANLESIVTERTLKLKQTIEELEAFSYTLSHDLRAPLRAIQAFAQIIRDEHAHRLEAVGTDMLARVVEAAKRMDRLILGVLSYTRVSRQEIRLGSVDVEKLLQQLIRETPEFESAKIRIQKPLLHIFGDDASVSQCLTNLLSNAVKFVPPGVKPEVRIWTEELMDGASQIPIAGHPSPVPSVRLCFQDNGTGIDALAQQRLFQLFQRHHNARDYEGTGIGLAIVRKAVQRMGGQVGVESEPGKGSTFWVLLPKG